MKDRIAKPHNLTLMMIFIGFGCLSALLLLLIVWQSSFIMDSTFLIIFSATFLLCLMVLINSIQPFFGKHIRQKATASSAVSPQWSAYLPPTITSPAAIVDGFTLKYANPAFLQLVGMADMQDLVVDMPLNNLIHPSHHAQLNRILNDDSNDALPVSNIRLLCFDGSTLPVELTITSLQLVGHPLVQQLQISPDDFHEAINSVSEQHPATLLLERIEQTIFHLNTELQLILLTPFWLKLLDYTIEESLNKSLIDFIHPEDQALAQARLNGLADGKRQRTQLNIRMLTKNGLLQWVDLRANTTSLLRGEHSSILGTLTDISRQKQTEAALRANARSTTDMIMNTISVMVYRCKNDRFWSLEYVSSGCHELIEYQPYEVVNSQPHGYMNLMHPDDKQRAWDYVQQQLFRQQSFQLIYRLVTRSGKIKWVFEQGKGVFSNANELLALEGVVTEIQASSVEQLQQGLQHIESLNQAE
ncbi:PAS domain-containing protein [Methylophaga pinxianii]|uniref:PAS domain-containing protein n=1 Tax=Methylophaga pinxianii TaxID=2881052 RepID=UPI001CF329F7|nr:PAS domain-containing protein [Methylophaga pinxianii]MCB2426663.1 PAS domain-containing protein [Methylophaga pinxianii]UPH45077.1 PAS domain-containing protein [Methylophaga pinxianii]